MCVAGDFIIREVIVLDQCFLLYRMEAKNSHPTGMLPLNVWQLRGSSSLKIEIFHHNTQYPGGQDSRLFTLDMLISAELGRNSL